ncbi:uncharacterized protein LOC117162072 [Bombus vancouverensis nearcticus]|uniref:uncharacterized protein LOC117162072 n=1 Tax=Bombus vancouverensis nearcticus TaxID=2705178 RepID=UPI00402B9833
MTSNFYLFMESLLTYKKRQLTYRTWVPYDYSSTSAFLLTLLYQSLFTTICSFGCIATDSLYSGLLIHINCQFEILEHRLKNIESNQNYSVKLCVRHHDHIYKYFTTVGSGMKSSLRFNITTKNSLELSDVIFRSDWTSLNNNVKRAFLMLMRRAMRPIEFTSIYVISVNLESFMTLLKTSYSVFSVFQQSQES